MPATTADLPVSMALERAAFNLVIPAFGNGVSAMRCRVPPRNGRRDRQALEAFTEQNMNAAGRRVGEATLRISRNGQIQYFVPPYDAFQENPARCR